VFRARFVSPHPIARLAPLLACALLALLLSVWAARDARARRAQRRETDHVQQLAARVIGPELALHGASRWLRHPTRSEPWAASADAPAMLDLDPAGALAPPPVSALREGWPAVQLTVQRPAR
jgi:hypothetical protein